MRRSPTHSSPFVHAVVVLIGLGACATGGAEPATVGGDAGATVSMERVASELERLSGPLTEQQRETFRGVLADTVGKDAYLCLPSPMEVFFGERAQGGRVIKGAMPHYGFFFGPMQYLARRTGASWTVEVIVSVEPPTGASELELPDCALRAELEGPVRCTGTPYSSSGSTEACPKSGSFRAPATEKNIRALLSRWSRSVERYWTRDATRFGLPIRYDFEFVLAEEAASTAARIDLHVPLSTSCGRTPYFASFRSGWSLPVLAHEVGHVLGLLDEYETFSGIVAAYPKTPFPGAQISRMGLSMRESTLVLPVHHYLILRRWFCSEPAERDPWGHVLP